MNTYDSLNSVLVRLFNDIMDIEERALITGDFSDISVNDMHVIEAIGVDEPKTMSTISKALGVTMGTLTTELNSLVRKGYVIRSRSKSDRRIVHATLTEKGILAYNHHVDFHKKMVDSVMQDLTDDEAAILNKTFTRLLDFFAGWK